jgi:hypothetical protein
MKKTTTTQDVATLTAAQLEQSGIKSSINQNDIVEIISTEAYDRIMQSIQSIPQFDLYDYQDYSKVDAQFMKKIKASKHYNESLGVENNTIYHSFTDISSNDKIQLDVKDIHVEEGTNDKIKISLQNKTKTLYLSGNLRLTISGKIDDVSEVNGQFRVDINSRTIQFVDYYSYKASKTKEQILSDVEIHNQKVMDFYNSIPVSEKRNSYGDLSKIISYDAIAKQARVHVNKNIIKNQAPEVVEQLNKLFNINL